jgi:hypothetical protein
MLLLQTVFQGLLKFLYLVVLLWVGWDLVWELLFCSGEHDFLLGRQVLNFILVLSQCGYQLLLLRWPLSQVQFEVRVCFALTVRCWGQAHAGSGRRLRPRPVVVSRIDFGPWVPTGCERCLGVVDCQFGSDWGLFRLFGRKKSLRALLHEVRVGLLWRGDGSDVVFGSAERLGLVLLKVVQNVLSHGGVVLH